MRSMWGVWEGVRRYMEGCGDVLLEVFKVHGGVQRCMGVCRGAHR